MKAAFKWFDIFLNLLLISIAVAVIIYYVLVSNNYYNFSFIFVHASGNIIESLLLISFGLGLLYIIIGTSLLIVNWKVKNAKRIKVGKRMLLKGIIRSIVSFILIFLLSLALSFFNLGGIDDGCGSALCLPKLPDVRVSGTPGFPIKDLQITNIKAVPPQTTDDTWECEIAIQNNNTSLNAVNITFNKAADNMGDSIPPNGNIVITILPEENSKAACNDISITAAEILIPDTSPSPRQ